jgi:hypothetical protein
VDDLKLKKLVRETLGEIGGSQNNSTNIIRIIRGDFEPIDKEGIKILKAENFEILE